LIIGFEVVGSREWLIIFRVHTFREIPVLFLESVLLLRGRGLWFFVWKLRRLFALLHHLKILLLESVHRLAEIQNVHVTNSFKIAFSLFGLERVIFIWILNDHTWIVVDNVWGMNLIDLIISQRNVIFTIIQPAIHSRLCYRQLWATLLSSFLNVLSLTLSNGCLPHHFTSGRCLLLISFAK